MKLFTLTTAIMLGFAFSVGAQQQTTTDEQQQQPPSKGKQVEQTTDQPTGPTTGHSNREKVKQTNEDSRMKAGANVSAKTEGGAVQTTTVFRNGKQTSERLSLHQGTRDRADVHFSIGTHPRDWWLRTYSIVLISGCHYYLADDGCWYPAYGFDPSCSFPEGAVYCD
jgi:hypothetical protein